MREVINLEKAQREKRNGMTDEEIQETIKDMEQHMALLPSGDNACQKLIEQMKNLLK